MRISKNFRWAAIAAAAAGTLMAHVPAHAWTQNAHYWASVGIFGRFNVVTRDDFSAKNSDMQCGFAAGGKVNLQGGYTIGKSGVTAGGGRPQVGALIGGDLSWTQSPSGTIDGDLILGGTSNVAIASDASVTLLPGNSLVVANANQVLNAVTPELWAGWGSDTANWGYGNLNPNNSAPGSVGWTGHSNTPLPVFFQSFFNEYLTNMSGGMLVTPANGVTKVASYSAPRTNIELDGLNLGRCDMPGNNATNCSATNSSINHQPGGRRAVYVFDVKASDLSNADVVNVKNVRSTDEWGSPTWTVIKVKADGATKVRLANVGLQDLASRNRHTVWVFDHAIKTIEVGAVGVEGTILAPKADVLASNGHINGSIIAKSFSGTLEGHCAPFENYIDP